MEIIKLGELTGHSSGIYVLESGRNGQTIFSGGGDRIVAEWNLETDQPEPLSIRVEHPIYSLCYMPSLHLLAVGHSGGGIHLIDLENRKEIRHFTYHSKGLYALRFNEHTGHLYASSGDGSFSVWDMAKLSHLRTLYLCDEKVRCLAISPDGQELAVGAGDGLIRVFDTTHFNERYQLKAHTMGVNSLAYHPGGHLLISGGKDAFLHFWDKNDSYRLIHSIPAHNYAIYSIAFNPGSTLFATASRDKTIKIWDSTTFDILKRLDYKTMKGHNHSVNSLLWHQGQDKLLSAGDDKRIISWKIKA
jgi:WD40 repeat protein